MFIDVNKIETNALNFFCLYPEVYNSMKQFTIYDIDSGYSMWLKWKEKNESILGGEKKIVNSITFGKGIFYNYNFCGLSGWFYLFLYVYECNKK